MPIYTRPAYVDSSAIMWYDVDSNNIKTVDAIVGGPEVAIEQFDSTNAIQALTNVGYDEVGSTALLSNTTRQVSVNTTVSGSSLRYAGHAGNDRTSSVNILCAAGGLSTSASGTWRCIGDTSNASTGVYSIAVYKRIT